MYVPPQIDGVVSANNKIKVTTKPEKRRDRDTARMREFQKTLANVTKEAELLGFRKDESKSFSPVQLKHAMEKYIAKKQKEKEKNSESLSLTSHDKEGKRETPSVDYSKGKIMFEKMEVLLPKPPSMIEKPTKAINEMSAKSEDKRYVKSTILSSENFPMIRRYVSHLFDSNDGFVNSVGETRLSVECMLRREGIPVGKELAGLYREAIKERGYSDTDIDVLERIEIV